MGGTLPSKPVRFPDGPETDLPSWKATLQKIIKIIRSYRVHVLDFGSMAYRKPPTILSGVAEIFCPPNINLNRKLDTSQRNQSGSV